MSSLPSKPGSPWSLAHLLLLTKFLTVRKVEPFLTGDWADRWKAALGETEPDAIRRFASGGLLVSCPLAEKIAYIFSDAALKGMLRERGLKLSGRKEEKAERLCSMDPEGMETALAGVELLKCSEMGRQLADEFVGRKERTVRCALEFLQKGKCEAAVREICDFKDALGFPPMRFFPDRPNLDDVRNALSARPLILAAVSEGALEQLRVAAAMGFLGLGTKWFAGDTETGTEMSCETAVNMIIGSVQYNRNLASWLRGGVKRVKILGSNSDDSCEACKVLWNRVWPIEKAPELPHPQCTFERGCRCCAVADCQ
jgi:hypothetical protein